MPLRLTKAGDPQVGHFMTSLMVVDEAPRFWGQRLHTNGSEEYSPRFRRTLLERSGSPRNMFEGGLSSDPFPRRGRLGSGVTGTYVGLKGPREPPLTRGAKPPFGRAPN